MSITQKELILNHLQNNYGLTQLEATERYGITRLQARIYELKKEGYNIVGQPVYSRNRYNKPVRYFRYILKEKEKEEMSFWDKLRNWL